MADVHEVAATALPADEIAREAVLVAAMAIGMGSRWPHDLLIEAYEPLEGVVPLASIRVA